MKPHFSAVAVLLLGLALLPGLHFSQGNAVGLEPEAANACAAPLSPVDGTPALNLRPVSALDTTWTVYAPAVVRTPPTWADNDSTTTQCAEEDNVNVPLYAYKLASYRITATHPQYDVGADSCAPDFTGCGRGAVGTNDSCGELLNNGTDIVEGCTVEEWWRPYTMQIMVGATSGNYHYLRLYRRIQNEGFWPQFLVLYQDGNLRLKPQPPPGVVDTCFGSSVVIGPAAPAARPYVDIATVRVDIAADALDVTYRDGTTARIRLMVVDRVQTVVEVDTRYPIGPGRPFAIFRSMYVADGNADVDHVHAPGKTVPILGDWLDLEGPWWFFYRAERSSHNTSAPDIRVEVSD